MSHQEDIAEIRREYGNIMLDEHDVAGLNPFTLFHRWFKEVLSSDNSDKTAMVLSTVDAQGKPDSRIVLLKGLENDRFIFYTNYESHKAAQCEHNPWVALNFYWPEMCRQVRVRGQVMRIDSKQSDAYFAERPRASQLSAIASPQSHPIASRQLLEDALQELSAYYHQKPVPRPDNWGGYCVIADDIEFWQGRDNRLHDRLHYQKKDGEWHVSRLAP